MKPLFYILEWKIPKPVEMLEWSTSFDVTKNGRLWLYHQGKIVVSTIFLWIDHSYNPDWPPILFETMIFWGKYNKYQERYSTWEEAEKWHEKAVALVSKKVKWKK